MINLVEEKFYKNQLVQNFNLAAPEYDQYAILQKYTAEELIDRVDIMNIQPKTVLDLGSGTGRVSRQLSEKFPKTQIVQVDISPCMLKKARDLQRNKNQTGSYLCADAERLPFTNNSFDMVISNLMLQWAEDLQKIIVDVVAALKPGGVFVFTTLGPSTLMELRDAWASVDNLKHVNDFMDMHIMGDALIAAGLSDPVMETDSVVMKFESVREIMKHLKNLGVHNINRNRRHTLTGKGKMSALIEAYETWREQNGLPCSYEVVYGHAWKPGLHEPTPAKQEHTFSLDALKQSLARFSRK